MLEWLFWTLVLLGVYPFAIYPLVVWVLSRLYAKTIRVDVSKPLPTVTVVIAAYNEADCIEETVRNKLACSYPEGLLRILVVSDASDDGTDSIVEALAMENESVSLLRQEPRQGKTAALNMAVPGLNSDIVIFSDANSLYALDSIEHLARAFSDESVGYVTGKMIYVDPDGSVIGDGCTAFMRYENALRQFETRIGSIVGVDGGIDAVRRNLYEPMRPDQLPDFVLPLSVVEKGYRCVFEPSAVVMEKSLTSADAEFRMRVRVSLRALWALWDKRVLLNVFRYGRFSWQLLSHKLLRYLAFAPLGAALLLNVFLMPRDGIYVVTLSLASVSLLAAAYGALFSGSAGAVARLCHYFLLVNAASAVAWVRFMRGQKQTLWRPRSG